MMAYRPSQILGRWCQDLKGRVVEVELLEWRTVQCPDMGLGQVGRNATTLHSLTTDELHVSESGFQ
jgi:hypothetical protein